MIRKISYLSIALILNCVLYAQEADVLKSNGIMFESQMKFLEAAQSYEAAIKAYEANNIVDELCIFKAGQNYVKIKMYDKAIPFLTKSINNKYNNHQAYICLADAFEGMKNYAEAESTLINGKAIFPDYKSEFIKSLAYLYFNSQQYEKATSSLEIAIEEDDKNVSFRYLYASSFEKMKNYKSAVTEFENLLTIDPEHAKTVKKLGFIYFKQTDFLYKKEIKRYEAIKNPSRVDYHNSKKKLTEISQGYKKALPYLEKTHQKYPEDKTIMSCLSVAYRRLDMDIKANEMKALLK